MWDNSPLKLRNFKIRQMVMPIPIYTIKATVSGLLWYKFEL